MHDAAGRNEPASPWAMADTIVKRIRPPTIPALRFPIDAYGAVGDGVFNCSGAIAAAIAAASTAGGGRVIVPPGVWLTGAVHLKSHVELHVAKNAILRFSPAPDAYPVVLTRHEG